jgi:hypothetical protein
MYDASYILRDCKGRIIPDGFSDQFDSTIWNVGFVFRYSGVIDMWLDCNIGLTVKPDMSVEDAYEAHTGDTMSDDYNVFFATGE